MLKRITRSDVARDALVSGATVSRAYNHPDLVDPITLARVRESALKLGFVPDKHASALRRSTSTTLLFVEIENTPVYHWPNQRAYQSIYGEIIRSVIHTLQDSMYHIHLVSLHSEAEIANLHRDYDFAGIIGFDLNQQSSALALAAHGRPVVCAHHQPELAEVSTVCTDNFTGGLLQAQYLISKGAQKICYVSGLCDMVVSHHQRRKGCFSAIKPALFKDNTVGYEPGRLAGKELAQDIRQGKVDAIAAVNDLTALGLIRGLADEGITVPQDVLMVGYDNLVMTGLLSPGLPTIEASLPNVYTQAIQVLIARLNGSSKDDLLIPPKLVFAE